jgi:solute carrier family 20 (sodium-dependent phosphate transporter)
MLIKVVVHMRSDPVFWAVWTSPFFFLIAGTVCTLTIVYKGSPKLGLSDKPGYWIAGVTLGTGFALCLLSFIFFLPFVRAKVLLRDNTLRWWDVLQGPLLWKRQAPADAVAAKVPNFAVIQHTADSDSDSNNEEPTVLKASGVEPNEKSVVANSASSDKESQQPVRQISHAEYKKLMDEALERHHANIRKKNNLLGWAMRVCHNNQLSAGSMYEIPNIVATLKRIPAMIVVAALYGTHYDIHTAQIGIEGTPEGRRMARTYAYAPRYPNEVEYAYSFVQIITACTASFAHGANDVGNAVGVWAGMVSLSHVKDLGRSFFRQKADSGF